MATSKSSSNTSSNSTTKQSSATSSNSVTNGYALNKGSSVTQSSSSTKGGSVSNTSSYTQGGSHTETSSKGGASSDSSSYGGANSQTTGRSWASGVVDDDIITAKKKYENEYQQSQQVSDTYNRLQDTLNNKPGAFTSSYTDKLNSLYDQLMNREKFSYNFNADPMYKQYRDQYTRQGKQAMQDTMGQAASLTGGYSSSYSQTAGQQAYQNYLTQLNEMIPELRNQAYQEWQAEGEDLKDKYNFTQNAYDNEYNRYRDTVSDWQQDRSFEQSNYQNERNFDYSKYSADRNYFQSEYWNQRNAEQSNSSNTDQTNWNKAHSDETNWSNSVSDSTNWSKTNSTTNTSYWSNTDSVSKTNSINESWTSQATKSNSTTDSVSNTTDNSATNEWSYSPTASSGTTNYNSGGASSGSGNGSGNNGFWYTANANGYLVEDRKGHDNGDTSVSDLNITRNKGSRDMIVNYLDDKDPDDALSEISDWVNGKGMWGKSGNFNEADAKYVIHLLGLDQ